MQDTGDSPELEALFDSIAASTHAEEGTGGVGTDGLSDTPALQALFDEVSSVAAPQVGLSLSIEPPSLTQPRVNAPPSGQAPQDQDWVVQDSVYNRVGKMVRELHDALREMGYDKGLESTISAIPDTRDRLAYIANLTEQAACKVLNATDIAQPTLDQMQTNANSLALRWDAVFNNQTEVADFRALAEETRAFLNADVPSMVHTVNAQILEIVMAQDFQDLTGQVIKKIVGLVQSLEGGLMKVLLDAMPQHCRESEQVTSLLNGPVVSVAGRTDVLVNQQQVDDLLDTLGF